MDSHTLPCAPRVREHIASVLEHARERDRTVHAFVEFDAEGALRRAGELDALPEGARGPLHGLPVAIKEVIDAAGRLCAWGSPLHAGRRPASNAPLVRRLTDAGAVPVGITASTEYALAAAAATVHPRDPLRSPGASSSGSAAAVAAGMVPLALGTQTIGSIIRPAAYCGVVGFKPTFGRYPTEGMLCLSARLDHAGILARDVAHAMAADRVLAADADPNADAAPAERPPLLRVLRPWFAEPVSGAVSTTLAACHAVLRRAGFAVEEAEVAADIAASEAEVTDTLLTFELAQRHGPTLRATPGKVSAMLREMLARGEAVSAARFDEAVARQADMARRLDGMLDGGRFLLAPATVGLAPPLAEGSGSRAPQRLWTLGGLPAITLPVGEHDGMPVGLQVIGGRGEDAALLRLAARIEAVVRASADV